MTLTITPETADQEAVEAQALAVELEARLKAGDFDVTAAQLATARQKADHAVLRAEGVNANAEREAAAELNRQGEDLHARFVEDILADFENMETRIVAFAQAAGALFDSVTTYEDRRVGYKRKWNALFAGNTDLPAALRFKANSRPGGDFGALADPHHVARKVTPVQLVIAVLSEVITSAVSKVGELDGIDRGLRTQLASGGYANGLRSLRELRKQLDKEKK
jgi:ribosomal protein L17